MYQAIKIGKISTSRTELIDIAKAWLAISLAFAFVQSGISIFRGNIIQLFSIQFMLIFVFSLFTAGIGFLFHELAHKFAAQHYGCVAEFRAFDQMLYLAVGLAVVIGFIFAAPGAVMISGMITRRQNGIISVAGPLTNYVLALIFFGVSLIFSASNLLNTILFIGFWVNLWLGLFNLIPFGNFDGKKIFDWSFYLWCLMVATGILGYLFSDKLVNYLLAIFS